MAQVLADVVCLSVCLSVRPSQVSILLKWLNVGSRKQCRRITHSNCRFLYLRNILTYLGILLFWCRESPQNPNRVTPNGGAKYRWGRLNAGEVAETWQRSTHSVVNLARSQVYHTECPLHVRRDAVRCAGLSATADPCTTISYILLNINKYTSGKTSISEAITLLKKVRSLPSNLLGSNPGSDLGCS